VQKFALTRPGDRLSSPPCETRQRPPTVLGAHHRQVPPTRKISNGCSRHSPTSDCLTYTCRCSTWCRSGCRSPVKWWRRPAEREWNSKQRSRHMAAREREAWGSISMWSMPVSGARQISPCVMFAEKPSCCSACRCPEGGVTSQPLSRSSDGCETKAPRSFVPISCPATSAPSSIRAKIPKAQRPGSGPVDSGKI